MSEMRLLQDYGGFWLQYNNYVAKIQRYTCVWVLVVVHFTRSIG